MKAFGVELLYAISQSPLLAWLFDMSLAVSALILFLLVLRPFMKRLPRAGMYALWFLVAVRLLCPVTVQGIYHFMPEQTASKMAAAGQKMSVSYLERKARRDRLGGEKNQYRIYGDALFPDTGAEIGETEAVGVEKDTETGAVTHAGTVMETGAAGKADAGTGAGTGTGTDGKESALRSVQGPNRAFSLTFLLTAVWLAGVSVALLFLLFSSIRIRRRLSGAELVEKGVYAHPLVDGSFVAGIFRPRIYLSGTLAGQDRDYVLAHERIHIRRRDYLLKPLYYLLCAIYWFHPLMWLAWHLMSKDMEVSCDEAVVRNMEREEKQQYSYLLLSLSASGGSGMSGSHAAFSAGTVRDRIQTIMKCKRPTVAMTFVTALVLALAGCGAVSSPQPGKDGFVSEEVNHGVYVEQMKKVRQQILEGTRFGEEEEDDIITGLCQDYQGEMLEFLQDRNGVPLICGFEDAKEYPSPWKKNFKKIKKKYDPMYLTGAEIGADGYLYVTAVQSSMPLEEYRKNQEKVDKEGGLYYTRTRLFKIDRESGGIGEIDVPQTTVKEYYEKMGIKVNKGSKYEKSIAGGKAVMPVSCLVCPDGQILVADSRIVNCLYDPVLEKQTLQLQSDLTMADSAFVGDGFFVYLERNYETKQQIVHVVSLTTGEEEYSVELDTKMVVDAEGGFCRNCAIGVAENTILMADHTGIYEMEYGTEEFRKVVDAEKDNVYYLRQADGMGKIEMIAVYKGEDDYYVSMGDDEDMLCHYAVAEPNGGRE